MRSNLLLLVIALISLKAGAQDMNDLPSKTKEKKQKMREFGIRAGYNIPRMAGQKKMDFKPGTQNGYTVSISFSPASRSGLGFRSELVYSSQHFGFDADGQKTSLRHDYVYLPQFTTIGLGKFFQLQLGGQLGILLNAKQTAQGESKGSVMSLMNKIDYGAAGGLEVYPLKGLIVGGRYNMNFGKTYKSPEGIGAINPLPFSPADVKGNNAVINLYLGYKF